jgi:hypothetical protein
MFFWEIFMHLNPSIDGPVGIGEKVSLGGVIAASIGVFFAAISPESFSTWVSVMCSSALIATGFGLAIWHRIEDQRRAEYQEWRRVRAMRTPDPDFDPMHPPSSSREIPIRLDTPDPDAQRKP